ncbi:MAG: hypothetical protein JO146_02090 [Candidatus Eremiobacteraeota bacterium]|nr:hypothetical protein [Candidatus Eremiobacteraeota bacterium]
MKYVYIAAIALLLFSAPLAGEAGRGGGFARTGGGFDMHAEAPAARPPGTYNHSSTGPYGTNRNTTVNKTNNGYNRTTTANNGNYNRTTTGGANTNGNYYHGSSGSGPNGSYNHSGSGNYYNHTYNGSTNATNAWGQTYHSSTYANNGYVYHGATVSNPYYHGVWGWNGGVAWYPAPYYWGGGFWGAFAVGVTSAAVYGSIVAANNATYTSYQVEPQSPGAKLLSSYSLTQTQCGPPNLVVIYGPNNSVICAYPNNLVSAGNYSVNSQTLTIVSEKPA